MEAVFTPQLTAIVVSMDYHTHDIAGQNSEVQGFIQVEANDSPSEVKEGDTSRFVDSSILVDDRSEQVQAESLADVIQQETNDMSRPDMPIVASEPEGQPVKSSDSHVVDHSTQMDSDITSSVHFTPHSFEPLESEPKLDLEAGSIPSQSKSELASEQVQNIHVATIENINNIEFVELNKPDTSFNEINNNPEMSASAAAVTEFIEANQEMNDGNVRWEDGGVQHTQILENNATEMDISLAPVTGEITDSHLESNTQMLLETRVFEGEGAVGEPVTLSIAGKIYETVVDKGGDWVIKVEFHQSGQFEYQLDYINSSDTRVSETKSIVIEPVNFDSLNSVAGYDAARENNNTSSRYFTSDNSWLDASTDYFIEHETDAT